MNFIKFISSRHRVISSIYITVYKCYKCAMHFPSLCAVSWWFHTVTEMSFILVGPGMPFSFHQSQYRLLIVSNWFDFSFNLVVKSKANIIQNLWKAKLSCIYCSLLNYHSSTSRKTLRKTTTVSQPCWIECGHSLNWLRLLCVTEGVFSDQNL